MEFVGQTRVLVIDDDENTRQLLKTILQPLGCAVTEGENGFEAVEHVERGSWDVVLLDISMPGLDGLGALERIRRSHTIEELPVILLTGRDDHAVKMEGLRLRANEFLTKPFEVSELLARIGMILMMRRGRLELEDRLREVEKERTLQKFMMHYVINDQRGPLTGARTFLKLALAQLESEEGPVGGHIKKAFALIERAAAIGSDAADLSQLEEGRIRLQRAEVDLGAMLAACMDSIKDYCRARKVDLQALVAQGMPPVCTDARLLERVLDNLLTYVTKYAGPGGVVEVFAAQCQDSHRIVFTAHADTREKISMKKESYELGLAFCQRAVAALGGEMSVNQELSHTMTLSVTLPQHWPPVSHEPQMSHALLD